MRIDSSTYSVSEILEMLGRRDLTVDKSYQRASRIWPPGPRTYFIDTIIKKFPFPKLYFYERFDIDRRKTLRNIVDGQQRITTIIDFIEGKFRLTNVCKEYAGQRFSDLPEDAQTNFLSYTVSVDVIRNAEKSEILEMFRRMNAYTLPLNEAEKRHSTFQGEFKWFINQKADDLDAFLQEFGVFTERQIMRMADAELIADSIVTIEQGIVTTTSRILKTIYEKYDNEFQAIDDYSRLLDEIVDFVVTHLGEFRNSPLMKPYVVHSLFSALYHNKYGLPAYERLIEVKPIGAVSGDVDIAKQGLEALSRADEAKESDGEFGEYVWSCQAGTNTQRRRAKRVQYLCRALQGSLLT